MILPSVMPPDLGVWYVTTKFDGDAASLADRHYPRRKVGARQFMPPGQTLVLVTADSLAVFGWHRPDPAAGVKRLDGLDGWCCSIFRNEREREREEQRVDPRR